MYIYWMKLKSCASCEFCALLFKGGENLISRIAP